MSTIVRHTKDDRGMVTSQCPRCRYQFIYWDDTDLDENGDLRCFCEEDGIEPSQTTHDT